MTEIILRVDLQFYLILSVVYVDSIKLGRTLHLPHGDDKQAVVWEWEECTWDKLSWGASWEDATFRFVLIDTFCDLFNYNIQLKSSYAFNH